MKKKQLLALVLSTSVFLSTSLGTVSFAKEDTEQSVTWGEIMEDDDSDVAVKGTEGADNSARTLTSGEPEVVTEDSKTSTNISKDNEETENVKDISEISGSEEEATETEDGKNTVVTQSDEEATPTETGTVVYLDFYSGSDTDNDGSDEEHGVQSIKKALELAGKGGTIIVTGQRAVQIKEDVVFDDNLTIKRGEKYSANASILYIEDCEVTINHATIEGGYENESSIGGLIDIFDATVIINDGAKICNARNNGINVESFNKDATLTMNGGEIFNIGIEKNRSGNQTAITITNWFNKGSATFTMNDGAIHDNVVSSAIYMTNGNGVKNVFNMNGGSIMRNKPRPDDDARYSGTGVSVRVGTFNMTGGVISENQGSGVSVENDLGGNTVFNMTGGEISENTAGYGAGIVVGDGTVNIEENALITRNQTADDGGGGGIAAYGGKVNVTGGTISENTACYGGGIASWSEGVVTIEGDALITKNKAIGDGGGGVTAASQTLTLNGGTISENEAPYGAGVAIWGDANAVMSGDMQITGNKVLTENGDEMGGAVYIGGFRNNGSTFTMTGGSITNNTTDSVYCAGIAVNGNSNGGTVDIQGGTISGNTNANGIKSGVRLYKGTNTSGVNKNGVVKLSGSPDIADEIYLNDNQENTAKVEVTEAFTPKQPVPVNDSSWTNYRTIVTYAAGLTAKTDDFTPASGSKRQTIIKEAGNAQNLQSMNSLLVIFREKEEDTKYGELYILPDGTIDESKIPETKKEGCTLLGWKEEQTDKDWDFKTDTVTKDMTLYPVWRVDKIIYQVTIKDGDQDHGTIDVEKNQTIAADKLPELTRPGYDFMGWETVDGKAWDVENDRVTSNIELHPVWKLKNATGNITADNAKDGKVTVHTGESIVLTATANHEAEGDISYQFTWFKDGKELKARSKGRAVAEQNTLEVTEAGTYSVKVVASDGIQTTEAVEIDAMEVTVEDHNFGEWVITKQPTETEKGLKERSCKSCGVKETAEIPATGKKEDPKPDPIDPTPNPDDKKDDSKPENDKKNESVKTETTVTSTVVTSNGVKTGDTNAAGLLACAMVIAAGAGAGVIFRRKKHS